MNRTLRFRSTRLFGVLLMLVAWFAMSNHCALLAMQSEHVESACCHSTSTGKHHVPSSQGVCCKLLRAVPLESAAKLVAVTEAHILFDLVWENGRDSELAEVSAAARVETTGPPRVVTFAELVLQRSLRSHAPPFLF